MRQSIFGRNTWQKRRQASARAYDVVTHLIPDELRTIVDEVSDLKFQGSTGLGNITAAPWIATFDTRLTSSATTGFYLVYLFSIDLRRLYLCFGLGATQFNIAFPKKAEAYAAMTAARTRLAELVERHLPERLIDRARTGLLDLNATSANKLHRDYEQANIFHLLYDLQNMPDDNSLAADYKAFVKFLQKVVDDPTTPDVLSLLQSTSDLQHRDSIPTAKDFVPRAAKKRSGSKRSRTIAYSKAAKVTGDRGELVVLEFEHRKLVDGGRPDLAERVVHEEAEGNRPGWDISSFDLNGNDLNIEVKAVTGSSISMVELTENEWRAARQSDLAENYYLYLVTKAFSPKPEIEILRNPSKHVKDKRLSIRPVRFNLDLRDQG